MEGVLTSEYKTLINELIQGMEKTKQLQFLLFSTSESEAQKLIVQRILHSYEKALIILKWNGSMCQVEAPGPPMSGPLESPMSIDKSPRSDDLKKNFTETSKKRKFQPTWREQVKVNPGNGLEGPSDDGHNWRKYGQKDILGAKYPRSYYRCTYHLHQNCWARKQVQRSDEDPTRFDITYRGKHTCIRSAAPPPLTPKKQKLSRNTSPNHEQLEEPNLTLLNFKSNLRVDTKDLDNKKETTTHSSFPSTILSCDLETNYFPDISELNYFSAETAIDYSFGSLDFSVDHFDLDPYYSFTDPGFFAN